jgi:HlyD family secretion protein
MTRWLYPAAFILAAGMLTSCSESEKVPGGSGLIEATEVTISAEAAGRLEKLYFDEGDKIESRDTVAVIDTTNTVLRLREAEAMLAAAEAQRDNARIRIDQALYNDSLAQKEFNRIDRLLQSGSANQQQYDQAENAARQSQLARKSAVVALESAKADIARIEAQIGLLHKQLSDCRPVSHARGTVVTKYVEEGELLAIGRPIIKVARIDSVWVKVYLPPADLTEIKLGDKAEVDPEDGKHQPLPGTVIWISSEAEFTPKNVQTKQARADLVYAVKVMVHNNEEILKIGMPVSVKIP